MGEGVRAKKRSRTDPIKISRLVVETAGPGLVSEQAGIMVLEIVAHPLERTSGNWPRSLTYSIWRRLV